MKPLWAPWRMQYVEAVPTSGCFVCAALAGDDVRAHLVLARDAGAIVLLNKYPYGNGHLLIAPHRHAGSLDQLEPSDFEALMAAVRRAAAVLERAYRPEGMNIGMNLGHAAGAGLVNHLHWHLLPRWNGDTNFMPLLCEAKVISEHLETTYDRLRPLFS